MKINVKQCAEILLNQDNILILTHAHPDGDTLGSGFALCRALMRLGKICSVVNADEIPKKYDYLYEDIAPIRFKQDYVVAVDVATTNLLGSLEGEYHIDMCIDHHSTNTEYADYLLLEDVPAACQLMYKVITELGVDIDKEIANCLYTGLTTDTGCFRYASTTADTYRTAAQLIDCGADNGRINRVMFENKTKTYARLERLALDSMRFYENERVAVITITRTIAIMIVVAVIAVMIIVSVISIIIIAGAIVIFIRNFRFFNDFYIFISRYMLSLRCNRLTIRYRII